jgi:hypothetical protein
MYNFDKRIKYPLKKKTRTIVMAWAFGGKSLADVTRELTLKNSNNTYRVIARTLKEVIREQWKK